MRFDDRLRTVLAQPAADPHDRAIRWRQLVELVARADGDADRELVRESIAEIGRSAALIDERVRSASAVAIAQLSPPAELVAAFSADRISVAAPVLASARLTASEWRQVLAAASEDCRSFVSSMRSEHAPEPQHQAEQRQPRTAAGPADGDRETVPSISDVVARIERLRQSREPGKANGDASRDDEPEQPARLFRWECNESGEIGWVDGAPRGAVVGQSISQSSYDSAIDRSVERAFALRAPFHEGTLELGRGGTTAGLWKISGMPAFEPSSGRFSGYRGIAERADETATGTGAPDADSLRELAHEIRTPLNAIIGFAEIIAGEYLGPAERQYRERASEVVAQARLLLAAVEDLDFAAKLRSHDGKSRAQLAACLDAAWDATERAAQDRGAAISIGTGEPSAACALNSDLCCRLVERFCLAAVGTAGEGEALTFRLAEEVQWCSLIVNRPAALEAPRLCSDHSLRSDDAESLPLRLVIGLARTAGGSVDITAGELALRLPKA